MILMNKMGKINVPQSRELLNQLNNDQLFEETLHHMFTLLKYLKGKATWKK
jgi:hypothetical protein